MTAGSVPTIAGPSSWIRLDTDYRAIIEHCVNAMRATLPDARVAVYPQQGKGASA